MGDGRKLSIIMPGHGTYILKGLHPRSFNIQLNQDLVDISTPLDSYHRYMTGLRHVEVDLSLSGGECIWTPETNLLQFDLFKDVTILEMLDEVEKKLRGRNGG